MKENEFDEFAAFWGRKYKKGDEKMKIKLSEDVKKNLAKETYYNEVDFANDAVTYIKAVESGRILYTVTNVSKSGMSRDIKVRSFEGKMTDGYYRNYNLFLRVMGEKTLENGDIRVYGCGMNMLFHTNYNIINNLLKMGFLTKAKADILAQKVH